MTPPETPNPQELKEAILIAYKSGSSSIAVTSESISFTNPFIEISGVVYLGNTPHNFVAMVKILEDRNSLTASDLYLIDEDLE